MTDRNLTMGQTQALRFVQDVAASALTRWRHADDAERRRLIDSLSVHAAEAVVMLEADLAAHGVAYA